MSGVRKKSWDGDLFPRNSAPNSTPRIRKRDGEVLFSQSKKRQRTRQEQTNDPDLHITQVGATLSWSRLQLGMTTLALVIRADVTSVRFELPGGIKAIGDPQEELVEGVNGKNDMMDNSESEESDTDGESEAEERGSLLWNVVKVGEIVRVSILHLEKNENGRVVRVSVKPEMVNKTLNPSMLLRKGFSVVGVVQSVEDHGSVVSFGGHINYKGFMKGEFGKVGELVDVATTKETKKSKRSVIKVTREKEKVLGARVDGDVAMSDLTAGMLVKGMVGKIGDGGAIIKVGVLSIAVDSTHIPEGEDLKVGDTAHVRLLYVDPVGKRIAGSMLDSWVHNFEPRGISENWKIGTLLENFTVDVVKPKFGLTMSYIDEKDESIVPIVVNIRSVVDAKDIQLENQFYSGMTLNKQARIVGVSKIDGLVHVDMRNSVLQRKALSLHEIVEGETYDCRIISVTAHGSLSVAVEGDSRLIGIVPKLQISDVALPSSRLSKNAKFRVGANLSCRALFVNEKKSKVILTARSSLLSPKFPLLTSFDQAMAAVQSTSKDTKSSIFTGYVNRRLDDGGLVISFCGNVAGKVPASELSTDSASSKEVAQKSEELYPVGQTVAVRVMKVFPKMRRMLLSMNLDSQASIRQQKPKYRFGRLVSGVVRSVNEAERYFVISVLKQDAVIAPDQKSLEDDGENTTDNAQLNCHLPFGHLSDVNGMSEKLSEKLVGTLASEHGETDDLTLTLNDLLLITERGGVPVLSAKESLKKALDDGILPKSFEDVSQKCASLGKDGKSFVQVRGYVKALLPKGVIVGFLGGVVGLARINRIADHFVSDPARVLKIGQSVSAAIIEVDNATNRFYVSLRMTDVSADGLSSDTVLFFKSLAYWQTVFNCPLVEKDFPIGSVVEVPAGKEHAYGFVYDLNASGTEIQGVALSMKGQGDDAELDSMLTDQDKKTRAETPGKKRTRKSDKRLAKKDALRVLDVDPLSGMVDFSRDTKVIDGGRKKSVLQVGNMFNASVLLVKSTYIILLLKRSKTRTAIAYALSPAVSDNLAVHPGMSVECTVLDRSLANTRRNLVSVNWKLFRNGATPQKVSRNPEKNHNVELRETIEMLLSASKTDDNGTAGRMIRCKVTQKFATRAYVAIGKGVVGHLHVSNTFHIPDEELQGLSLGCLPSSLASKFQLPDSGSVLKSAYVAGVRKTAEEDDSGPMVVEVSLSKEKKSGITPVPGQKVLGFIKNLSSRLDLDGSMEKKTHYPYTIVTVGPETVLHCKDVDSIFSDGSSTPTEGSAVVCRVLSLEKGKIWGSISENVSQGIVMGKIPGIGIKVEVPWHARPDGMKSKSSPVLGLCDVHDNFEKVETMVDSMKVGGLISLEVCADELNSESEYNISMRCGRKPSLTYKDNVYPLITPKICKGLKKGDLLHGFVRAVTKKGCFVTIGRNVTAQIKLHDLSDEFVKDPEASFPNGKFVKGRVGNISFADGKPRVSMVIRKRPRKELKGSVKTVNLKEGDKVEGVVKKVESYGALLDLGGGTFALLHKKEADQDRIIQNPSEEWVVGQKLTAIVIKVDAKGIKLGTKRCYFEAAGIDEDQLENILGENDQSKQEVISGMNKMDDEEVNFEEESEEEPDSQNKVEKDEVSGEDETEVIENLLDAGLPKSEEDLGSGEASEDDGDGQEESNDVTPLKIPGKFDFGGKRKRDLLEVDSDSESEEDDENSDEPQDKGKKKSKERREKKRKKEAEETTVRLREESLANDPRSPKTTDDYERLLVSEPNSSEMWIRYMGFSASLSQIDKARAIAERALDTINLTREEDRTNIWIAYINLEAQFGASNSTIGNASDTLGLKRDAAVFRVFDRGCQRVTDVKSFHLRVAASLRVDCPNLADEVLKRALRRFKTSKQVWVASGLAQYKSGDITAARRTLEKALLSLERSDHVAVISKFTQFEYKFASEERGRTVFESLVGNFPKRLDLWNVYLDMEARLCGNASEEDSEAIIQRTRSIFERATKLDLSSKKMKSVFQKWLEFEKKYGRKESQSKVKKAAREFVERTVEKKE